MAELVKAFRPELLHRLDDVLVFHSLTRADSRAILDIELSKAFQRLREKNLTLMLTDEAIDFLIEKGTSRESGAHPLRRVIEQHLVSPLSAEVLRGSSPGEYTVQVHVTDSGEKSLIFHCTDRSRPDLEL